MKDIEDRIKEKYDEEKVPDYMFDTSRVFKRVEEKKNKKKIIDKVAASIIIVIILIGLFTLLFSNKINDEIIELKEKSITDNIVDKIEVINSNSRNDKIEKNNFCGLLLIERITEYKIIQNIPYTKIKAKVIKNYLNELPESIEIFVPGGIFKVKDIKDNINIKINLEKYNEDDLLQIYYYNDIYIPFPEKGKIYISTLKEVDGQYYVDINRPYGFKEYDPETNIVKDDMGDIELDIDKYLKNISK